MASTSWNAESRHPELPSQPTFYIPYVDSNNSYDRGPPSTSPTGFLQPIPPLSEPEGPPHPLSNAPPTEDHHRMYTSQLLDLRTVIHNGPLYYASDACRTVGMPHPPQAPGTTGQQAGMLDQKGTNMSAGHGTEYTSVVNPCLSTVSAQQAKDVSNERPWSQGAFSDAIDCKRSGLKMYNVMLGQTAEVDKKQSAEDMRSCSLYGSQRPAQPSRDHLSCLPDRSAYFSTEPLEGVRAQSTLTPSSHIPVAISSDANQEPLAAVYDEAEWDANTLWFYIRKYYEATIHGNSIMPFELLNNMVNQFLTDRECWAERSGADIDVAMVFLTLSIGKLYTEKQSLSFSDARQPIGSSQSTQIPGFTYFQRGKDMFHRCSPTVVESIRANSLTGCYLYQLGDIPKSIEYLSLASQFARGLLLSEIQRVRAGWPCRAVSTDAYHVLRLYTSCISVENEAYSKMLEGVISS
ncbi:hypothetical protein NPX13_g5807 [Xylaria arbuscula]|uniref:Uncharacterized protein n=1 Tax=Xylaria arbuscula TaxID=114810 RepID=A0A9W8NDN3_9PEZI|nr:hypothetical protein NPX13_g5807 [Xylaria arbuscula]